jgi:hypothetical protein
MGFISKTEEIINVCTNIIDERMHMRYNCGKSVDHGHDHETREK